MLTRYSAEVISLDKVASTNIEWLWPNHIPRGMLTLIAGDPGIGKSYLAFYLAANVSSGRPFAIPQGCEPRSRVAAQRENFPKENSCGASLEQHSTNDDSKSVDEDSLVKDDQPGTCIILNNDDIPTTIMCPRLSAMGADLSKIKLLHSMLRTNNDGHEYSDDFNLATDIFALKDVVCGLENLKLLIIDPINSFLGRFDSCKYTKVHSVLLPLIELARKYHFAVVGVMHLNKNNSSKMIYRTMGSIALPSFARVVWFVTSAPDDPNKRLFTPAKNNILLNPLPLSFEIKDNGIIFDNACHGVVKDEAGSDEATDLNVAIDWLKKLLADGNPLPSKEIFALANQFGFSKRTLQRAVHDLDIICFQGKDLFGLKCWFWRLPILT